MTTYVVSSVPFVQWQRVPMCDSVMGSQVVGKGENILKLMRSEEVTNPCQVASCDDTNLNGAIFADNATR